MKQLFRLLAICIALAFQTPGMSKPPQLVLLLTVDQLRGDMPWRFRDRFSKGGFRYLMDRGVAFRQAYYQHATTLTAAGHATLVTGGHAAQHGQVGNDWYDVVARRKVYSVEDDRHRVLGKPVEEHQGTSPQHLTCSTFGDELVLATGGKSRVFSVSLKDRGAIIPGGHLGKAFWYASETGEFITSSFYYKAVPTWVRAWNMAHPANRYRNRAWKLLQEKSKYVYAARDDRPVERSYKGLGRVFPHPLDAEEPKDFYDTLRFTPMADELTLDFVKTLVTQEKLGSGSVTDVLLVSLSATDYVGHAFGPNSLEMEDNLLRLDRSLEDLFKFLGQRIGLNRILVVLSSDHGISPIPEHLAGLGMAAGRHKPDTSLESLNEALGRQFNTDKELVSGFFKPNMYLDQTVIAELGLDVTAVERALAAALVKLPGYAYAVTRSDILAGSLPADPILEKVQRGFHPQRSGNVIVVQSVSWFLDKEDSNYSAMHGSPYPYDTFVPIMFAGPEIEAQSVERLVAPADVAPTITSYLGINTPSGAVGKPLVEVLRGQD